MGLDLLPKTANHYTYLDQLTVGILITDRNGNIIYVNKAIERIFGYTQAEVSGNGWWRIFYGESNALNANKPLLFSFNNDMRTLKKLRMHDREMSTKNGETIWTRWTYSKLENGDLMTSIEDISETVQLRQEMEHKKRQNEILRQEVHHRVKNNMQIVISLLKLQFRKVKDPMAIQALSRSKERMIAFSLIHDYLCLSENLSFKQFGDYLDKLTGYLNRNYATKKAIKWRTHFSGNFQTTNNVISLGLIISELVINALKHAFTPEHNTPAIDVILTCEPSGKVILTVGDNGQGLQQPLDLENPTTLGYEIVILLIHQIEGRISVSSHEGTKVNVIFYQ